MIPSTSWKNQDRAGWRGETRQRNVQISIAMSAMTICSRRSECRLDTDSFKSCNISCNTSTRVLSRLIR